MKHQWRFEVKVKDNRVLRDYLQFKRMSYADLAHRVHEIVNRGRSKAEVIPGPSKATIGHLVSGETTKTKPIWATAIEEALGAPAGALFVGNVSRVSEDAERCAARREDVPA